MAERPRRISVPHPDLVGRTTLLRVVQLGARGATLAVDGAPDDATRPPLLLPKREVPKETEVGSELTVFVRPIKAMQALGEAEDKMAEFFGTPPAKQGA